MADNKQKKDGGATVRVPQWLLDEVEEIWQKLPRPRPTRGEIIAEAWRASRGGLMPTDDDPDLARVRYILEHSQRVVGFRSAVDLFYSDTKANPRPRENDKPKRKVG